LVNEGCLPRTNVQKRDDELEQGSVTVFWAVMNEI
jgi:hypothetical protein